MNAPTVRGSLSGLWAGTTQRDASQGISFQNRLAGRKVRSVFRAQPDRVSTLPEIFGSVATRVSSPSRPPRVPNVYGAHTLDP